MADARELGCEKCHISGGEPTLYKHLIELIEVAKTYGFFVSLNANGSLITEDYAKRLLAAGLDQVHVSLYGHTAKIHDSIRRKEGLWEKATQAVRIFSKLRSQYPDFILKTQTILCRDNYKYFAELIKLHYDLGSLAMAISYLEGDFERKNLLNEKEIRYFKHNVVPKAIQFCEQSLDKNLGKGAKRNLNEFYREEKASLSDFARGIYQPKYKKPQPCTIPSSFTLIYANGDVCPCTMTEYSHRPILGNLFKKTLPDIWNGEKWSKFRNEYFNNYKVDYCQLCPMKTYMC